MNAFFGGLVFKKRDMPHRIWTPNSQGLGIKVTTYVTPCIRKEFHVIGSNCLNKKGQQLFEKKSEDPLE